MLKNVANLAALVSALFVGIVAFFFSKKAKKTKLQPEVPKNIAADQAKAQEAQTLQDNLKKIDSALNDNSPADSLSDLGNARRRD